MTEEIEKPEKIVNVAFYKNEGGNEPVKDWLLDLDKAERSAIGTDLKTVEYGWPLGMPLVKSLSGKRNKDLWEVRTDLPNGTIARVIFTMSKGRMVLLHGFIKKTQGTPKNDLELARVRKINLVK